MQRLRRHTAHHAGTQHAHEADRVLFQTLTGWLPVGDDAAGGRPDPGSTGERRGGPHKGRAPQADGEQEPYRKGSNRETEEQEKVESGVPGPMGSSKPNDRLSVEAQIPSENTMQSLPQHVRVVGGQRDTLCL